MNIDYLPKSYKISKFYELKSGDTYQLVAEFGFVTPPVYLKSGKFNVIKLNDGSMCQYLTEKPDVDVVKVYGTFRIEGYDV